MLAQLASSVIEAQVNPGDVVSSKDLNFSNFDERHEEHFKVAFSIYLLEIEASRTQCTPPPPLKKMMPVGAEKALKVDLMHKHALTILSEVISVCGDNDALPFVISGTFLGLIRDKGFISHDYDIDLGVFEYQCTDRLLDKLNNMPDYKPIKLDYPVYREMKNGSVVYRRMQKPTLIKLFHKHGTQIDIFVHYEEGNLFLHGSSLHRWENKKFTLKTRNFLGLSVESPEDFDTYLTENYGNWRKPVKKFNCSTGTPNVALSKSCKTQCYFLKRAFLCKDESIELISDKLNTCREQTYSYVDFKKNANPC